MRARRCWPILVSVALLCAPGERTTSAIPVGQEQQLDALTRSFASLDVRDMNGRRWSAEALRGRIVVLDFWATWCKPCWDEIPWLKKIQDGERASRVQVLGVSLDVTDRRTLVAWLNHRRVDWPQVWQPHGYESVMAEQFGVRSLPASLLVDAKGRARAFNLRGATLLAAVDALLADPVREETKTVEYRSSNPSP